MSAKKIPRAAHRANLLIEIGVEELPPRTLKVLADSFAASLARGLSEAGLLDDAHDERGDDAHDERGDDQRNDNAEHYRVFATPRRLAALVRGVSAKQPERVVERRGPSLSVAFDADGKPTKAAEGFAKSCGVGVAQLHTIKNTQGEWLVSRQKIAGAKLADIVTDCLAQSIRQLPIAKRMRWGERSVEFVRPARWLLALHGDKVIKTQSLDLKADRFTRGHRFLATQKFAEGKLKIPAADDYHSLLESEGKVIADFDQRRRVIQDQLEKLAITVGAHVVADDALLDLVTGMVEWPRALMGDFDRRFLKLPDEVLVSCMRDHQKYFHLTDDKGKLLPGFITVSNIQGKSMTRVRQGNERVLRARLADAEFFWNSDLNTPLAARTEQLKDVLFHKQLGSLHDKTVRVAKLARLVVEKLGAEQLGADAERAERAALLCKADLVTDMVGEFPELQGTMGRYYAKKSGEEQSVADAIEQHYWPRRRFDQYAGDKLPRSALAQSVAVADRIDSLIGIFACGEAPTGDKDRFALRRAALGVLRILIEKKLDVDLYQLLQSSRDTYQTTDHATDHATVRPDAKTIERVFEFMLDRLKAYYQPMGYGASAILSVRACQPSRPLDFDHRLRAISRLFKNQPEVAASLAAANKRIAGIVSKVGLEQSNAPPYQKKLSRDHAEKKLAQQLETIGAHARSCFARDRYDQGLAELSKLKAPVDLFFDEVMVMHEDAATRANRLALLQHIRRLFLEVADISHMVVEG